MEKNEKVKCIFDNSFIESIFFAHLSPEDKADIQRRLLDKTSFVCVFERNKEIIFCVVFDIFEEDKTLHVREFGGNFNHKFNVVDGYKILDTFCQGFAKFAGLSSVTFIGPRKVHYMLSEQFGFELVGENEYRKVLH